MVSVLPLVTLLAEPAGAANVSCGQTIMQNTTLNGNVGPCPNNGIIIGTNGITLNLNGFTVSGVPSQGDGAGILLNNRSNVTIMNGTVTQFDAGVAIIRGGNNTVQRVRAINNVGSGITDYGDGIQMDSSSNNRILDNVVQKNGPFSGIAVFIFSGDDAFGNLIQGNTVSGNDLVDPRSDHGDPTGTNQDIGIRLEPFTHHNTVRNNIVEGSGLDGIQLFARTTDNQIIGNTVRGNGYHNKNHRKGDGIAAFSGAERNLIQDNFVTANAANGIVMRVNALDNDILDNRSLQNEGLFTAIIAYDLHDQNRFCAGEGGAKPNEWRGNQFMTFNQPCVTG
jgi:parallel beta-helix repeat protein